MDAATSPLLPQLPPSAIDVSADAVRTNRQGLAWRDVRNGFTLWRLATALGWLDIKLRYRGSMLGPFWLTISTAVMIAAMGGLYGSLFHMDLKSYLPFLATSLILWNALGALVGDACQTFLQAEGTIRSLRMPFFVHAIRVVVRTVVSLAHNLPVMIGVFALYGAWPGIAAAWSLPGLALWLLDAFAVCLLLGCFCARFRDVPPIVASIMQIAFFVTPIVWRPEQLGTRGWWLPLNPFDGLLEIVRAPMLGGAARPSAWESALVFSALLCAASWYLFARVRTRLAFWM